MTYVHPFVIYAFFGTLLGTGMIAAATRWLPGLPPRVRRNLWWVPLLTPFAVYAVSWSWRSYDICLPWLPTQGFYNLIHMGICQAGILIAYFLTPIFLLASAVGIFKALASLGLAAHLVSRFGPEPPDSRIGCITLSMASIMSISAPPVVVVPRSPSQAFTVGIRRPTVVLSRQFVDELDEVELEAVIAHELAHVRAGDHWRKWLSVLLRDVLFFTFVSFLVFRNLQRQSEIMADEGAARTTKSPLALASALIKGWKLNIHRWYGLDNFVTSLSSGTVEDRVRRLMHGSPVQRRELLIWRWLPLALALITGFIVSTLC